MIGNRPQAQRAQVQATAHVDMPVHYAHMLDTIGQYGGVARFIEQTGQFQSVESDAHACRMLPGTMYDWLALVTWGMVEGCGDGTNVRLTERALETIENARSPKK